MNADPGAVAGELAISARLERIGALGRRGAAPAELLPELRALLCDVASPATWADGVRVPGEEVVERLRPAPHRT